MILQELADRENALYSKVIDLYHQPRSAQTDATLQGIFLEYRKIHEAYAELCTDDDEALKRGLFIQWYALAEPCNLTGISDLNSNAENKIVQALNERLEAGNADGELNWMFKHYASRHWIFERLASFKSFNNKKINEQDDCLPDKIDKVEMARRGQMGKYWNSLTQSSEL